MSLFDNPKESPIFHYQTLLFRMESFLNNSESFLGAALSEMDTERQEDLYRRFDDFCINHILNADISFANLIHRVIVELRDLQAKNNLNSLAKDLQVEIPKIQTEIERLENWYHLGLAEVIDRGTRFREISQQFFAVYKWLEERDILKSASKQTIKSPKVTFDSKLSDNHLGTIKKLVDDLSLFREEISIDTLKAIFECTIDGPIQVNNNQVLATLFNILSNKRLICIQWQSVIAKNNLFVGSLGKNITAANLAVSNSRLNKQSEQYKKIDKAFVNLNLD